MPWRRKALLKAFSCFGGAGAEDADRQQSRQPAGASKQAQKGAACGTATTAASAGDYGAQVVRKASQTAGPPQQPKTAAAGSSAAAASAAATPAAAAVDAASTSCSSVIPALYEMGSRHNMLSCDASTSYPTTSLEEEWDVLGACMTTAQEMEACVDAVLEGSVKSAQTLFARYDMDLDQRLAQQDFYDLMLELALALPYQEYQRFVEASFAYADTDRDGFITLPDFVPLYKTIAAVRRAFRRQDHHNNGQIDRYDFYQLLLEMKLDTTQDTRQELQTLADSAFSLADTTGRGIVNFGQTLVWYTSFLLASSKQRGASSRQVLEQLEQQLQQQQQQQQQ